MKKSGPKKITYTYFYCTPCKHLDKKILESMMRLGKLFYQNYCIHPDSKEKNIKRKFNQINDNLATPAWCPYLNK